MILAQPPPPPQPQQPRMQPVRQAPPPPTQQPQYQQPAAPRTAPVQPVAQQPQAQPTYYKTLPPTVAASTAPPKKSRKGPVIGVVIVVAILLIAVLAYLFMFTPDDGENGEIPTITYQELMDDIEVDIGGMDVNFKSYDDGDELNIVGTVDNIRTADVPTGVFGVSPGAWTLIFLETQGAIPLFEMFAYKGDLRSDYTIGEEATLKIKIGKTSAQGMTMEYPEEWMDASLIESYLEVPSITLEFTETSPGNYNGSITTNSDTILLRDLEIKIYDSSAASFGYDDGDLTDDDPEEINVGSGDLILEFSDVNNDGILDLGDTFTLSYAETGDEITLDDDITWETITIYTVP